MLARETKSENVTPLKRKRLNLEERARKLIRVLRRIPSRRKKKKRVKQRRVKQRMKKRKWKVKKR